MESMGLTKQNFRDLDSLIFEDPLSLSNVETFLALVKGRFQENTPVYRKGQKILGQYAAEVNGYFGYPLLKPNGDFHDWPEGFIEEVDLDLSLEKLLFVRELGKYNPTPLQKSKDFLGKVFRNFQDVWRMQTDIKNEYGRLRKKHSNLFQEIESRKTEERRAFEEEQFKRFATDKIGFMALTIMEEKYSIPIRRTIFDPKTKNILKNEDY